MKHPVKVPSIQWMIIPGLTVVAHIVALIYGTVAVIYYPPTWPAYILFVTLSGLALATAGVAIHFRACLVAMAGELYLLRSGIIKHGTENLHSADPRSDQRPRRPGDPFCG